MKEAAKKIVHATIEFQFPESRTFLQQLKDAEDQGSKQHLPALKEALDFLWEQKLYDDCEKLTRFSKWCAPYIFYGATTQSSQALRFFNIAQSQGTVTTFGTCCDVATNFLQLVEQQTKLDLITKEAISKGINDALLSLGMDQTESKPQTGFTLSLYLNRGRAQQRRVSTSTSTTQTYETTRRAMFDFELTSDSEDENEKIKKAKKT